jgi:hypothetical protein
MGFSVMSEAELRSYSQRQLMRMFIDRNIVSTIDKVLKRQRTPEEAEADARVIVDQLPPLTDPTFVDKTVALFAGQP